MNKRPKRSPTDKGGEVDAIWIAEDGEGGNARVNCIADAHASGSL